MLLGVLGLLMAAIGIGMIWQIVAARADSRRFPPPGTVLPGGLHVQTAGTAGPPVVIESGVAASSTGWVRILPEISGFCRAYAYDRPGYGWSQPCALSRTADQYVSELDRIVQLAGTPAVLVGHSFGGLLVQLYASRYPERVAGLVLVDPAHVCEWADPGREARYRLTRGVLLARRGAWLARVGVVRAALTLLTAGAAGASRFFAHATSSPRGTGYLEKLVGEVRKLPAEVWPVVAAHWCRPSAFQAMSEQLASLPAIAAEVGRRPVPPEIPVTVLSGGHLPADLLAEHRATAARSAHGLHVIVEGSGHWIQLDRPDAVIDAIRTRVQHG